jgi:hypothetical protein
VPWLEIVGERELQASYLEVRWPMWLGEHIWFSMVRAYSFVFMQVVNYCVLLFFFE